MKKAPKGLAALRCPKEPSGAYSSVRMSLNEQETTSNCRIWYMSQFHGLG
jgi:hypothetical protein